MILAIDPGISTGVAVLNSHGQLIYSVTLQPNEICEDTLGGWGTYIVIEKTPTPTLSPMNTKLREVLEKLSSIFPDATYIQPGVWKNSRPFGKLPWPPYWEESATPHQLDAFRLGSYYLYQRFSKQEFNGRRVQEVNSVNIRK